MGQPFQLIIDGETGVFDAGLLQRQVGSAGHNAAYVVVAVIGAQRTGKSTLMNAMFDANFTVPEGFHPSSTTKGIWLSIKTLNEKTALIFDTEGSDAVDNSSSSSGLLPDHKFALFTLFMADVLLINVECEDLYRRAASGFEIYKRIASVYADINNDSNPIKKTLIFVIRNWNSDPITEEKVNEIVREKWIRPIVNAKNETGKTRNLSELFDVEIVLLPSYKDDFSAFQNKAEKLKSKIIQISSRYDRRAPIARLSSWNDIWDFLVSRHKIYQTSEVCESLMKALLAEFEMKATTIRNEFRSSGEINMEECKRWISQLQIAYLAAFDNSTVQYHEETVASKRRELVQRSAELSYEVEKQLEGKKSTLRQEELQKVADKVLRGGIVVAAASLSTTFVAHSAQNLFDQTSAGAAFVANAAFVGHAVLIAACLTALSAFAWRIYLRNSKSQNEDDERTNDGYKLGNE